MDSLFTKEQKKKVHKKRLGIIVGVALCLALLPVTVFAEGGLKNTGGGDQLLTEEHSLTEQSLTQVNEEQADSSSTQTSDTSTQGNKQTSSQSDTATTSEQDQTSNASTGENNAPDTKSNSSSEQNNSSSAAPSNSSEQDATQSSNASDTSHLETLKGLIASLPEEVTEDNADEVRTQLAEIFSLYEALSEDEQEQIDLSYCYELKEKLDANLLVAAEGEVASVTVGNITTNYTTIEEAFTAANAAGKATITLLDNCDAPENSTLTSSGSDITLDLAGYTLTGNGQTSVITVAENTTFTLKDGTGTDKGTITGGFADNGGGVFVSVGASFTMAGATISGNSVSASIGISYGGGVYVDGDARFTMTGGIISGNSAANSVGCGGGVCVGRSYSDSGSVGGRFTMTGGSISGNSAGQYGGGVFLAYSDVGGRFTMDGGTISGNNAGNGGGVCVEGGISTFIMNEGEISGNTARGGGGVRLHFGGNLIMNGGKITRNIGENSSGGVCVDLRSIFIMNDGEISGNTATINDAGGVYVAAPATNVHLFEGTFTMKGGIITGNTAPRNGGGVHNGGIFNMEGGTITGNHAGKVGGGIFNAEQGLTPRFDTTLTFSGSPVVSGNTAGESENGAGDNVVLTRTRQEDSLRGEVPLALITLGELTDGAKIGLSVYDRNLAYPGHYYEYMIPTLTSAVQFTRAETDTSYYADSSQYFFSDNPNYGVRINSDDKYLELAPALTVTFNTQGGDLPLGASDTKTVVYGATYGELPTPTKSNFHFAAWSLSESDKGQHLHVGEDSEVTEKTDHTLYAHWQEKEVPEIDFSIPQTYDYDGKEHPFIFSVVNGPDIDDGLWEIYYFEHTGEFHEKPTDRSEFSTTPPKDVDDYCVVITHPETDQYAYFESEFIHNGIIIKAVDCTLSFETNGGSVIDPHKDKTGNTIDLSEFTTTKEGYSFTGWYRDEALTDKIESITLIGDTTVYAGWEVAPTPAAATGDEDTNSDESSDDGSTLPLTGSALQLGLLLLALCALAAALVTPLVVKRKRKKLDF